MYGNSAVVHESGYFIQARRPASCNDVDLERGGKRRANYSLTLLSLYQTHARLQTKNHRLFRLLVLQEGCIIDAGKQKENVGGIRSGAGGKPPNPEQTRNERNRRAGCAACLFAFGFSLLPVS